MKKKLRFAAWSVFLLFLILPFTVSAGGQQEAKEAEGVMEITWMMRIKTGEETAWSIQELEKKFNVKIIPNGIDRNDREKASVMLAAGEFPDCGYVNEAKPKEAYDEGWTRGIPESMIRKYAPNYSRILDKEYPLGWQLFRNSDNKDEVLSLSGVAENANCILWNICFRADWAKNVGIELPNYDKKKIPLDRFGKVYFLNEDFTLDWFEKLLIAFRDGDPDGNGKNDTIPYGACNNKLRYNFENIMGAFGLGDNHNHIIDGELYQYNIAPAYKDFLKLLARWYKNGLLDKEFVNLDLSKFWDKAGSGVIGACESIVTYAGGVPTRPPDNMVKDGELGTGAEVVMIPSLIGPGGQGTTCYIPAGPIGSYSQFYINKNVDDKKLAKILEIIDTAMWNGEEWWVHAFSGKPGVHFDWEGEAWNSRPLRRKAEDVPDGYLKQGSLPTYPPGYTKDRMKFIYSKHLSDFFTNYLSSDRGQAMAIRPYRWDIFGETGLQDINVKYGDTLDTIIWEFFYKAVTGDINIDAEWDSYVSKWRKNGGDMMIEEIKKAPIVKDLLNGKIVY